MKLLTIHKHSKAEEVQIALSAAGVPADVRVAFRQQHWAHLQATSSQICHHLIEKIKTVNISVIYFFFKSVQFLYNIQNDLTMSRSCSCSAKASSLLSIQEAAATSRGVDPRIPEQIAIFQTWILHRIYSRTCFSFILKTARHTQANATVLKQV